MKDNEITLTKSAVAYIQKVLQKKQGVLGVRLGVKPAGCSGLSYILDFVTAIDKGVDKEFVEAGVLVVVDPKSYEVLKGTELDCVQEGLNEILKFNNPNVKSACGCGESFSIEK